MFNFLLCELPLILTVSINKKTEWRYLQEDPRYRIWTRSVNWFRLYVRRRSHRQTDRYTHTHTHTYIHTFFLKHIFRLWEWCRMKNNQKIKVENFDDCNTSKHKTKNLDHYMDYYWSINIEFYVPDKKISRKC